MSEYLFVEKPLLDHLHALGWDVIDQGAYAIPSDPAASLRDDFREVTLRRVFCETVWGIGCRHRLKPTPDMRNPFKRVGVAESQPVSTGFGIPAAEFIRRRAGGPWRARHRWPGIG